VGVRVSAVPADPCSCDTLLRVSRLLVVLLVAVVIVEFIAVIGVAAALFWLGTGATMTVGAAMLVVTAIAVLLTLRAMRAHR
jgi:hypothetical protein